MHLNTPFLCKKFKNFLGRGPRPRPRREGDTRWGLQLSIAGTGVLAPVQLLVIIIIIVIVVVVAAAAAAAVAIIYQRK